MKSSKQKVTVMLNLGAPCPVELALASTATEQQKQIWDNFIGQVASGSSLKASVSCENAWPKPAPHEHIIASCAQGTYCTVKGCRFVDGMDLG